MQKKIENLIKLLKGSNIEYVKPVVEILEEASHLNLNNKMFAFKNKLQKSNIERKAVYVVDLGKEFHIYRTMPQVLKNPESVEKVVINKNVGFYHPEILDYVYIADAKHELCSLGIDSSTLSDVRLIITNKSERSAYNKEQEKPFSKEYYGRTMQSDYEGEEYGFTFGGNFFTKDLGKKTIELTREKFQDLICQEEESYFER